MPTSTDIHQEIQRVTVSTPGRICLFGEHQDYLNLPVIAAAISLRLSVEAVRRPGNRVNIGLPDLAGGEEFALNGKLPYVRERDYFRSGINVMRRHGFTFSAGFDCTVRGSIPINAGASSSTALVVSWMHLLACMSDRHARLTQLDCAQLAHEAEVREFGEPGGMMDHYTTALGGTILIDFHPSLHVVEVAMPDVPFVLGHSGEPKDTRWILSNVKERILGVVARLEAVDGSFHLHSATAESIMPFRNRLDPADFALLEATVRNHHTTLEAARLLRCGRVDLAALGALLNEHQARLREVLRISTPKIDRMIDAALAAGAAGAKINGSGGGGCMFALAPERADDVAAAIAAAGGTPYIVSIDSGTRIDREERIA